MMTAAIMPTSRKALKTRRLQKQTSSMHAIPSRRSNGVVERALGCMQAGDEKLGVIEASYASGIIGGLTTLSIHADQSPSSSQLAARRRQM